MQQQGKSSAVWVLALAVFAVGTGEFVLAGLIPEFADEFAVSIGEAGQIVTVFAVTCAIAGLLATAATARWPRRRDGRDVVSSWRRVPCTSSARW